MTEQDEKEMLAEIKAKHLASMHGDGDQLETELALILYQAIDEEFVAAGMPTQAEHELEIVKKLIALAQEMTNADKR